MTAEFRVLVTASREWTEPAVIWAALDECRTVATGQDRLLVVVHGDAPGGDQIAKLYGQVTFRARDEAHPADWDGPCGPRCKPGHRRVRAGAQFCPAAGAYRNEAMVALGADRAAAFIHAGSAGASGCARLAERAGIPTRRYTDA